MNNGTGLAEALLGFDGFRVLDVTETPDEVVITVETMADFVSCGSCGPGRWRMSASCARVARDASPQRPRIRAEFVARQPTGPPCLGGGQAAEAAKQVVLAVTSGQRKSCSLRGTLATSGILLWRPDKYSRLSAVPICTYAGQGEHQPPGYLLWRGCRSVCSSASPSSMPKRLSKTCHSSTTVSAAERCIETVNRSKKPCWPSRTGHDAPQ
jgi:hypothetical protein